MFVHWSDLMRIAVIAMTVIALALTPAIADMTVGVYSRALGGSGVLEALSAQPGLTAVSLESMDLPALVGCDVVVIESLKGLGGGNESWREAIRTYVAAGGGMVLGHDAVGGRGWDDQTRLFPEIAAIGIDRSTTTTVRSVAEHPVTAGLPAEWQHAYTDHIYMQVGPEGDTVINDADGLAATIVGTYGKGRVVANGMISGYGINADGAAGPLAPTGNQLALLLNAIRWAGEGQLSAKAPGEVIAAIAEAMEAAMAQRAPKPPPYTDWYTPTAVQEMGYQKQPLSELGGRAWMWWDLRAGYTDQMIHRHLQHMKRTGVTDLIYLGQSGRSLAYPSDIPDTKRHFWLGRYKGRDPLAIVTKAAKAEGIRVWLGMHSGDYGEGMVALDHQGKPYMYGNHPIDDVMSPALRAFLKDVLTEVKQKYDLAGFYYDELFFNYVDMHGDDFDGFSTWCQERFGEKPEASLVEKLAAGPLWMDHTDVWWRRLMLYKAWCNADFFKYLADTARGLGMESIGELRPCAGYATGATYGMDNPAIVRAGCTRYYVAAGGEPAMVYPNACTGQHHGRGFGFYNTYNVRGKPTFNFVYYHIELPFTFGTPEQPERMLQLLRDCREWEDAQSLCRVAQLTYQYGIMLNNADPRPIETGERELFARLGRYQDIDRLETEDTQFYPNYRVLVAPPASVQGHGPEVFDAIEQFVRGGGTVISLGGRWMQSRRDFTQQVDVTARFLGGEYGGDARPVDTIKIVQDQMVHVVPQDPLPFAPGRETAVIATFTDGSPAVTSHSLGQGRVIALHLDVGSEAAAGGLELEEYLASLIAEAARPEVRVLNAGAEIKTTLRKGNWVACTMHEPRTPAKVKVSVDLQALDLQADGYRVLLYGRSRELLAPSGMWDITPWTAEQLREGLELTIPSAGVSQWVLPGTVETAQLPEREQKWLATVVPDMWAQNEALRTAGFEMLVIAPHDELSINGEKAVTLP